MPHRLNDFRARIQIVTSSRSPALVRRAAKKRGFASSTHYLQHVILEAVARDLELDNLDELKAELPPNRADLMARLNGKTTEAAVPSET